MFKNLLFPHSFKLLGWILLIPALIIGLLMSLNPSFPEVKWTVFAFYSDMIFDKPRFFQFMEVNILPSIVGLSFILGGIFVAFSRVKVEDEYISELRLSSLMWAVYVNYALLFLSFLFVYNMPFFTVMVYNMFTVLIIFIIRFHYLLYKSNHLSANEK